MAFKVKKPYDRYFSDLEAKESVLVNDKSTGLYFLRLSKNLGVDNISMTRIRHNQWIMSKRKPFHKRRDLTKYSVFD
jgi:hypothetical protein